MIIEKFNELDSLISYLKNVERELILKALKFSNKAHKNQLRKSGEPFIFHPIEVAKILTTIKLDGDSIVAGLLHDTVEDTALTVSNIKEIFGQQILLVLLSNPLLLLTKVFCNFLLTFAY